MKENPKNAFFHIRNVNLMKNEFTLVQKRNEIAPFPFLSRLCIFANVFHSVRG